MTTLASRGMTVAQYARWSWKVSSLSLFRPSPHEFHPARYGSHGKYSTIQETNPFEILGIPKVSTYHEVKRRFVELALQHHPDLNANGDSTEFLRFRQAFEMIRSNHDGTARIGVPDESSSSSWSSDQEFMAWVHEETGHQDVMFRMDVATRREVTDLANTQSQGGLDRGGMWEMARVMAKQEESLRKKKKDYQGTIGISTSQESDEDNRAKSPRQRRRK